MRSASKLLSASALQAFKWSMLGEAASRVITPLTFLVLALLLVPEDFGVAAAATVVISLSLALAEAGVGRALVQGGGDTEPAASTAFWMTFFFGCIAAAVLVIVAPSLAALFRDSRVSDVVRVLSLQCVLVGLCTVPAALLQRQLRFRDLFWVRSANTFLLCVVSISLAVTGKGYWALVFGTLAGQLVQTLMLWRRCRWMPRSFLDAKSALLLIRFGRWAALSALLGWFYTWADALIVGHYLGAHDMGLYRVGNTLVVALFGLILAPLLPVLFPLFSMHSGDLPAVRRDLASVVRAIAVVSLPGGGLLVLASPLADALLATRGWGGIGMVIAILGATHGVAWLVGANGEALRGAGKPRAEALAMGGAIIGYLAAYVTAIQFGLEAFLWTRLGMAVFGVLVQVAVARAVIQFPLRNWLQLAWRPLLVAVCLIVLHLTAVRFGDATSISHLVATLFGLALYSLYLLVAEQRLLNIVLSARRQSTTDHTTRQ